MNSFYFEVSIQKSFGFHSRTDHKQTHAHHRSLSKIDLFSFSSENGRIIHGFNSDFQKYSKSQNVEHFIWLPTNTKWIWKLVKTFTVFYIINKFVKLLFKWRIYEKVNSNQMYQICILYRIRLPKFDWTLWNLPNNWSCDLLAQPVKYLSLLSTAQTIRLSANGQSKWKIVHTESRRRYFSRHIHTCRPNNSHQLSFMWVCVCMRLYMWWFSNATVYSRYEWCYWWRKLSYAIVNAVFIKNNVAAILFVLRYFSSIFNTKKKIYERMPNNDINWIYFLNL